jgi:hypothetical protein
MTNKPVALPLIRVCAWHTPKPELDRLNRVHPGQITHGMCANCEARMFQEVP